MSSVVEGEGAGDRGSSSKYHTSQQSSATGSISIEECGNEGNFIHLKNGSDKVICEHLPLIPPFSRNITYRVAVAWVCSGFIEN